MKWKSTSNLTKSIYQPRGHSRGFCNRTIEIDKLFRPLTDTTRPASADLTGIRLLIMEVHNWAVGVHSTGAMTRSLIIDRFNIDLRHTGNDVAVLRR